MKQSKGTLTSMKVILTILFFSQTVAAFDISLDVIGQVDNKHTLVCGQNVTFVCSVKPVTNSMDWFIDTMTVATCKTGFCAAQGILPANANFEYSTSEGIYNLTFSPVLASDDAREYKCQFGSDKKSIIPTVTVFPDKSFSGITNASSSNDINITVSTCVSTSDFVSFKWYIFKAGESRKLFDTSMNFLKNVSSCQSTSNCNGEMSTSTITIKNLKEENGDYFFFQIEILYTYSNDAQPYIVTIDSPTQYKISVKADPKSSSCWDLVCWIVVGVCVLVVGGVLVFVQWCCVKPYKELFEKSAKVKYGIEEKKACKEVWWWKMCYLLIPIYGICRFCIKKRNLERDTPDKPKEFTFDPDRMTCDSVYLSWTAGKRKGIEHKFNLLLYIDNEFQRKANIFHNGKDEMHYNFKGLCEAMDYKAKIFAEHKTLKVECGTEVRFKTKDGMKTFKKKHQRIVDKDEICCENCKKKRQSHASHAYCLSHDLYLCLKCLDMEHTHIRCVLLWNTDEINREDHQLCCKQKYKHDDLQLEGVCQSCNLFICSKCIVTHLTHPICTSHQQLHGHLSTNARMCCKQNGTYIRTQTLFCKQCKTLICASCLAQHDTHPVISPLPMLTDSSENDVICKGCPSVNRLPIECLALHIGVFLCASCYETGKLKKSLKNQSTFQALVFWHLQTNQDSCQVHKVLGNVKNSPVEVYCFICKLYMCRGCFIKHRRIYEYWSKTLEGNLFYCNFCPAGQLNPVECCDFTSFKCGNCYCKPSVKSDTTIKYTTEVKKEMKNLRNRNKQCQVHKNETMSTTAAVVYCLVCKTNMCKSCFKEHLKLEK